MRTEFRNKTGWDWRQLRRRHLVVALAPVVIGFVFSMQQDPRQQEIEDQRNQQAQEEIEGQHAHSERQPKEQRPQYAVLQSYLDQMSYLTYKKDLRASDEGSQVRTLARARTLTVLEKLGPSQKTMVLLFLVETNVIRRVGRRRPVLSLSGSQLGDTDLSHTDLSGADLSGADLTYADLEGTKLSDANLSEATLLGTDLNAAELADADLSGAILEDANLGDANLSNANLNDAYLYDANLSGANLSGALGLSKWSQAEASSLVGTTMPDGTKHP